MGFTNQPIIRGIQAVGAVDILYRYNGNNGDLILPANVMTLGGQTDTTKTKIKTASGVRLAGFRLDGEFLRATQQIASSVVIPVLGGGGVALTNNNRTGTLSINCAKVSTPMGPDENGKPLGSTSGWGSMYTPSGESSAIGVVAGGDGKVPDVYDMVFIAQTQQGQEGGDSVGSTICVRFMFCGLLTRIQFEGCTIAGVDPIGLSGNDAASYQVQINYLNWRANYSGTNPDSGFIA